MGRRLVSASSISVALLTLGCGLRGLFGPTATPKPPFIALPPELTHTPTQPSDEFPSAQTDPSSLPYIGADNAGGLKRIGGSTGLEFSSTPRSPQFAFSRDGQFGASLAWDGAPPEILSFVQLAEPVYVQRLEIDTAADSVDLSSSGVLASTFLKCPQGNCLANFDPISGTLTASYPVPPQTPFGLAVSPDGTRAAVGDLRFAGPEGSGSGSAVVYLMDNSTGSPIGILGEALFADLVFAPDGYRLAAVGPDGVTIWDVRSGSASYLRRSDVHPSILVFSPDTAFLATDGKEGSALIWGLESGEVEEELGGFLGDVSGLSWAADGVTLAVGTTSGEVRLVDSFNGLTLGSVPARTGAVLGLSFVHGGRVLATFASEGTGSGAVGLWGVKP